MWVSKNQTKRRNKEGRFLLTGGVLIPAKHTWLEVMKLLCYFHKCITQRTFSRIFYDQEGLKKELATARVKLKLMGLIVLTFIYCERVPCDPNSARLMHKS